MSRYNIIIIFVIHFGLLGCTDVIPEFAMLDSISSPKVSNSDIVISDSDWGNTITISGTCEKSTETIAVIIDNGSPQNIISVDSSANFDCLNSSTFSFSFYFSVSDYPELGLTDTDGMTIELQLYSVAELTPSAAIGVTITREFDAVDTIPDAFTLTDLTDVATSSVLTSNIFQVTGINAAAPISITGGQYRICTVSDCSDAPAFVTTAGTVNNGSYVQLQQTSSATNSTMTSATLDIGGVTEDFQVTTVAPPDTTPDTFTLTDITGATVSTVYQSNIIQVAGINAGTSISVTGGEYRICSMSDCSDAPAYTSVGGTTNLNDYVQVRQTSSAAFSTMTTVTLDIGGVTEDFQVTTNADYIPDAFTFTDQSNRAPNELYESDIIQITGLATTSSITITGQGSPEFRTCSTNDCTTEIQSWTNSGGITISNNEYIQLRMITHPTYGTANSHTSTLTIGGVVDNWVISNIKTPSTPVGSTKQLASGSNHVCALYANGQILCWGSGNSGRLATEGTSHVGNNEYPEDSTFVNLGGSAIKVVAGGSHTCALLANGTVTCWGEGDHGRTGYDSTADYGDNGGETPSARGAVNLGTKLVKDVVAGFNHTCVLMNDGTVGCWGNGLDGRLGNDAVTNIGDGIGASVNTLAATPVNLGTVPVMKLTAGESHTCALLNDGTARCWGSGASGRLGNGATNSYGFDTAIGSRTIDSPLVTLTHLKDIQSHRNHTCALNTSGQVYCWGLGSNGRLGYGNTSDVLDPGAQGPVNLGGVATQISVGQYHNCALLSDGNVKCWGRNDYGQLGYGNTNVIGDDETPDTIGNVNLGGVRAKSIEVGGEQSCALLIDGQVKCWGDNRTGQLGLGHMIAIGDTELPTAYPPLSLGGTVETVKLQVGDYHSCALLSDGKVSCWGDNSSGQITLPAAYTSTAGTVLNMYTAGYNTCILDNLGDLTCYGDNTGGQLTIGAPFSTSNQTLLFDGEWEFLCGITPQGAIGCWGDNTFAQTDVPNTTPDLTANGSARNISTGFFHSFAITHDGALVGWTADDFNQQTNLPVTLDSAGEAIGVSSGDDYSCGVHANNFTVACWGRDWGANLTPATGINTEGARYIESYANDTCGVSIAGQSYCWGTNDSGELFPSAFFTAPGTSLEIGPGFEHSCGLTSAGKVDCWGDNTFNQTNVPIGLQAI